MLKYTVINLSAKLGSRMLCLGTDLSRSSTYKQALPEVIPHRAKNIQISIELPHTPQKK